MEFNNQPEPPTHQLIPLTSQKKYNKHFILFVGIAILVLSLGGILYLLTTTSWTKTNKKIAATITPSLKHAPSLQGKENFQAISGDVLLTYFFDPHDEKRLLLRMVDFNMNTHSEIVLPYLNENHRDQTKRGKYILSPSGKYILRLTQKKLEIANLSDPEKITFTPIHTVSEMIGDGGIPDMDFASMADAMWDDKAQLYFITQVGADGVGNPFGIYTDLYIADEDGSNKRLINDHTQGNQAIGFMKKFAYIDSNKQEVYFTGMTHGGHLAEMIIVDAKSGVVKQTLSDIGRTIPEFNEDFSKAYYDSDAEESGADDVPKTKIYEYAMNSRQKTLLYSAPTVVQSGSSSLLTGNIFFNKGQNKLFFQVNEAQTTNYYTVALQEENKLTLLFNDNNCENNGISSYGDYMFLVCTDSKLNTVEYQFYQLTTGRRSVFYREELSETSNYPIQVVRLQ